ncbi:hypothetical protein EKO27_g6838 [Xylaria grammica]|uniref:Uncharacterized protein n=1 Tax=Xylaria grammica TaxID=363999 RepID=A0A439D1F5_9PEZI|nr:hypothetical protein EKO27_g6838 [Xylaria grammica]
MGGKKREKLQVQGTSVRGISGFQIQGANSANLGSTIHKESLRLLTAIGSGSLISINIAQMPEERVSDFLYDISARVIGGAGGELSCDNNRLDESDVLFFHAQPLYTTAPIEKQHSSLTQKDMIAAAAARREDPEAPEGHQPAPKPRVLKKPAKRKQTKASSSGYDMVGFWSE